MAKRARKNKLGGDPQPLPAQPLPPSPPAPDQPAKNSAAVQLGRLGGLKGGPARARRLSKKQRSLIARKAAQARWAQQRRS